MKKGKKILTGIALFIVLLIAYIVINILFGSGLIIASMFYNDYTAPYNRFPRVIKTENTKKLAKLISKEGVNAYYGNKTPLIYAVEENNIKVANFFIDKGADVNLTVRACNMKMVGCDMTNWKKTPLTIAREKGNTEIVELLIANGAKE